MNPASVGAGPGSPTAKDQAVADELLMERFRLLERIGSGGMGTVYRGFDERLQRHVAVKEVDAAEPERVLREAQAAARLNHPGIVTLYELGQRSGRAVLVSELVPGATLAQLLPSGTLSDRDVGELATDLCDALAHAHARGVVHRDIKPENVIVRDEGQGGRRGKLLDFGIARIAGAPTLTAAGEVVGTLAYMSPEQADGLPAGPESDVYSLALTAYECWAGENPIAGANPAETARRIEIGAPPLGEYRPDLPGGLTRLIDACLDPDPAMRPTPLELRDRLEAQLDRLVADSVPTPVEEPIAPDRGRAPAILASLLSLVLPAVGVAAAGTALAALAPRPLARAFLSVLCWAFAATLTDVAITPAEVLTASAFALAALALGVALAASHAALALVGALLWAAGFDAALRLLGDAGFGARPLTLAAAATVAVAIEFVVVRAPDPAPSAGRARRRDPRGRALSGRLA